MTEEVSEFWLKYEIEEAGGEMNVDEGVQADAAEEVDKGVQVDAAEEYQEEMILCREPIPLQ